MPELVRLYLRQTAIGFVLSALFVSALIAGDIAGLRHLVLTSDAAPLAIAMLFVANGIVFAGVQFAIAVMRMQDRDETHGPLLRGYNAIPVPVRNAPSRRDD